MIQSIRHISINGTRLGYEVHGEGSSKPAAIFVHGYSGRSTGGQAYPELLGALAEQFTVHALDARGHGASVEAVEGFSLAAIADDIAAFARAVGIVGAVFIGHSFGGFAGLYCEVRHPGTFGAICLLAPADAGSGEHKANADFFKVIVEHGNNPDVMRGVLAPLYVRQPALVGRQLASLAIMSRRVHEAYFPEYATLSFIEQLSSVKIPVLFVNGNQDFVVPLAAQHQTALALSNCKEVNFMAQGHMMPVEAADVVAREVIHFCQYDVPAMSSSV